MSFVTSPMMQASSRFLLLVSICMFCYASLSSGFFSHPDRHKGVLDHIMKLRRLTAKMNKETASLYGATGRKEELHTVAEQFKKPVSSATEKNAQLSVTKNPCVKGGKLRKKRGLSVLWDLLDEIYKKEEATMAECTTEKKKGLLKSFIAKMG